MKRTLSLLLLAVLAGISCAGRAQPEPKPLQIWVYWGGGAPREWAGRVVLPAPPARSQVVWLADFEHGDEAQAFGGIDLPAQRVPGESLGETAGVDAVEEGGRGRGLRLSTSTAGDADGVVLEIDALLDEAIDVELSGTKLVLPLGSLLGRDRVVELERGNVILAGARDLGEAWPPVGGWHRVSLHTHSNFSSNPSPIGVLAASLRPWVDGVWWTDHAALDTRRVTGGEFEDEEDLSSWGSDASPGSRAVAVIDADAESGEGSLRLEVLAGAAAASPVAAWVRHQGGRNVLGMHTMAEPRLRWAWRPPAGPAAAFVDVEWESGVHLRYQSKAVGKAGTAIVVGATPGVWQRVERELDRDLARIGGPAQPTDDAIRNIALGVLMEGERGGRAAAGFDAVQVEAGSSVPFVRLREEHLSAIPPPAHFGSEDSVVLTADGFELRHPHLTLLLPGSLAALESAIAMQKRGGGIPREELVRATHSAGGCVGVHRLGRDDEAQLLEREDPGVDLFEIGGAWLTVPTYASEAEERARDSCHYPPLAEDEVFPLLVQWDRLTARGLLLTGHGAPDLNGVFDRPTRGFFDRWLTWIESDEDHPEALLRALRSGRAAGVEWRCRARLGVQTEGGLPGGKLVATDRESLPLEAYVADALPGSSVRWIVGTFAGGAPEESPPAHVAASEPLENTHQSISSTLEVGRWGAFARVELREPTGHLVAFSNPIHAVPYWPQHWPYGRVAFDWDGVRLVREDRLLLDDARIEAGQLFLSGVAFDPGAELRLVSSVIPVARIEVRTGSVKARLDAERTSVVIEAEPGAPFEVLVSFDEALVDPPRGPLFGVADRSGLDHAHDAIVETRDTRFQSAPGR